MDEWRYTLNHAELERLQTLAGQRNAFWMKRGNPTKRIGGRSDLDIHRVGAIGEYAVCKMLDMPFNWAWDTADGHVDSTLMGKTVQIKTSPLGTRLLLFSNLKHFKADLAILAHLDDPTDTAVAVGWVSRLDFERGHEMRDLGRGAGLQPVMPVGLLRPMDTLVPMLERAYLKPAPAPPPVDLVAETVAAYVERDGGVGCRGCRSFTRTPTTLEDFAAWLHYRGCTATTPVEQISVRVDAVRAAIEEGRVSC